MVAALLTATFLSSLDVTVVGTAMPRITGQLGGLELYPWVFSIYLLTSTVCVPLWGKLADLHGRRPAFLAGIVVFLLGSLACGAAPSMRTLVWARALQGLGAGAIFPVSQTIFGDLFPVEKRARMQGLFSLVWGVSSVLGPAVGGAIVAVASWPWVFLVNLPVGVGALALFLATYHERPSTRPARLDLLGAGAMALAITLALLSLSPGRARLPLAAGALVVGGLFVLWERRAAEPVLPLGLFEDPVVRLAALSGCVNGPTLFGFIAYLPLFLQGPSGISPTLAGLLMAPMSLAWTSATFIAGRALSRFGLRSSLVAGTALLPVGAVVFRLALPGLPSTIAWVGFVAGVLAVGAGMGSNSSLLVISVQDRVGWERRGAATAIVALARQLGSTLGVAALGAYVTARLEGRLATIPHAPPAAALLDPHRLAALDPAQVAAANGALSRSLVEAFTLTVGSAVIAWLLALALPRTPAPRG